VYHRHNTAERHSVAFKKKKHVTDTRRLKIHRNLSHKTAHFYARDLLNKCQRSLRLFTGCRPHKLPRNFLPS